MPRDPQSPQEPLHLPWLLRPFEAPVQKDVARDRVDGQEPDDFERVLYGLLVAEETIEEVWRVNLPSSRLVFNVTWR